MTARSESREEYLEAIFKLAQRPDGATVSRVADELGLAAPSVSQMVVRLPARGWSKRDRASRVLLTKRAVARRLRLVRRHRLSERFLTDYLDLPWDQVHEEACKFEHVLSRRGRGAPGGAAGQPADLPARTRHPRRRRRARRRAARGRWPTSAPARRARSRASPTSARPAALPRLARPAARDALWPSKRRSLRRAAARARRSRPLRARARGGRHDLRARL